jgi:hypothetical protein
MDKRIIFVIAGALIFVIGFVLIKMLFFNKEKIEIHYVIKNIKNNQAFKDSLVEFSDETKDAIKWKWNFGDGQYSFDKEPKHSFTQFGDYKIQLTVSTSKSSSTDSGKIIRVINQAPIVAEVPITPNRDTTPIVKKEIPPPLVKTKPKSPPTNAKPKHKAGNHSFSTDAESKIHEMKPQNFDK